MKVCVLTDVQIRNLKYSEKNNNKNKLLDGRGLYIFVTKAGSKIWKYRYVCDKKKGWVTLGTYKVIPL